MEGHLVMSAKERRRKAEFEDVRKDRLTIEEAAVRLDCTVAGLISDCVNLGPFSVMASILSTILAMVFGFKLVLLRALVIYAVGVLSLTRFPKA